MKKFLAIFSMLIMFSFSVSADDLSNVKKYTQNVIDDAIVKIFNKDLQTTAERIPPFRKVINANLNFDFISNFVLGVYARDMTPEQKDKFIKEFAELNVYTFAKKFASYSDQKIQVTDATQGKKEGQYFVSSKVISNNPGDKDFIVDWRIMKVDDSYKVIDVIIEGVSMAMSYKNEYAPILKTGSEEGKSPVEYLTEKIQDKVVKLKLSDDV
ncbi:ABC transporter substrate-binding protein [bacterium]|nr:ABC transporter substrate-binding protein [bacterium]